jgi:N-acetylmuramoyl-L-alanine amidase
MGALSSPTTNWKFEVRVSRLEELPSSQHHPGRPIRANTEGPSHALCHPDAQDAASRSLRRRDLLFRYCLAGQKNFHKLFACVSPVFTSVLAGLGRSIPSPSLRTGLRPYNRAALPALALVLACTPFTHAKDDSDAANKTARRSAASSQYARAEQLRAELNSKPTEKRALSEYKQVVSSYRRVYLITPHAAEVPDAVLAIAELYTEMGDRFGRSYYQLAVDSYNFLLHDYPSNRFGQDAMLRVAKLERNQLGDTAQAVNTYQEFLRKYPRSTRKREVEETLAELALLRSGEASAAAPSPSAAAPENSRSAEAPESSRIVPADAVRTTAPANAVPHIRRISTTAGADSTRIIIDLEELVQYSSARIRNPDRIFFDLHTARLTRELAHQDIHVEGNLLTAIRVAQNHAGVVRVVLTVNGVKDYTATLLSNPAQLVVDLYPNTKGDQVRAARAKRTPGPVEEPHVDAAAVRDEHSSAAAPVTEVAANVEPDGSANAATTKPFYGPIPPSPLSRDSRSPAVDNSTTSSSAKSAPTKNRANALKGGAARPDVVRPVTAPQPTRDGQATLTRTLGLKIGRIVIDAGHGGYDTGTIGPSGLMEKDLCLDIALRLGKIIQQRLPGAEVVFTRSDDTFIPLEERTRIANEAKADLFISIHANSSHDHGARGIETYYLNLKGSPDAMEVAARENATSQENIHDLEDLIKKITQSEKIDESREFASDIQESLAKRILKTNRNVKDRGVRKAPFVVLIGADMPSILTEISFLSNPADEQLLKKPEHRQKVAEGLYQGVASYLQSLNSMTVNLPAKSGENAVASGSVEQSRNQR